jgi:hypothetical protein
LRSLGNRCNRNKKHSSAKKKEVESLHEFRFFPKLLKF